MPFPHSITAESTILSYDLHRSDWDQNVRLIGNYAQLPLNDRFDVLELHFIKFPVLFSFLNDTC